jgi:uncharacterized protein YjbI with pentapeptide repeats
VPVTLWLLLACSDGVYHDRWDRSGTPDDFEWFISDATQARVPHDAKPHYFDHSLIVLQDRSLPNLYLFGVVAPNVRFERVDLTGANLAATTLGYSLGPSELVDVCLDDAYLWRASLGPVLNGIHAERAAGGRARLGHTIDASTFAGSTLPGLEFSGALRNTSFADAWLPDANLWGVHAVDVTFDGANLDGSDLSSIEGTASFRGASLRATRWGDAELGGLVLDGATVEGADFGEVYRGGPASCDGLVWDDATRFPRGVDPFAWCPTGRRVERGAAPEPRPPVTGVAPALPLWSPVHGVRFANLDHADGGGLSGRDVAIAGATACSFAFGALPGVQISGSIVDTTFADSDLEDAVFDGVAFHRVDLGKAQLVEARFVRCSGDASFADADVRAATFVDTDVSGFAFDAADVMGADFAGATGRPASCAGMRYDARTRFPAGVDATSWCVSGVPVDATTVPAYP